MTAEPHPELPVATIGPCGQYRFRVELTGGFDDAARAEIYRRALRETSETFLECTGNFQAIGWIGSANLAFAESRSSPSDRKSKFLHQLVCLKLIEYGISHYRETNPHRPSAEPAIKIETALPHAFRKKLEQFCGPRGVRILPAPEAVPDSRTGHQDGEGGGVIFSPERLRQVESMRANALRRAEGKPFLGWFVRFGARRIRHLAWLYHVCVRVVFHCRYRAAFRRIARRGDLTHPVFLHFENRTGRIRDVGNYLPWKYSGDFISKVRDETSAVPFTHLARKDSAYSLEAMDWAGRSLLGMEERSGDGCVVVNFLLDPWSLLKSHFRRNAARRRACGRLRTLSLSSGDLIARLVYEEFHAFLIDTNASAIELAACYQRFFASYPPGVVVQADALSKGARQYTACARRGGSEVIYVADKICTRLRTSNRLIADKGDNPHFPDRCVVFDDISQNELIRQGFAADRIYRYQRDLDVRPAGSGRNARPLEILVILQDRMDHLDALISIGVEIARAFMEIRIIYQEHPGFPVGAEVKSGLLEKSPGRLRFLARGEAVDYGNVLAMVTGYSTAAVPGVLQGVPLIWLRRQIDNSLYGEAYLERIGFAADSPREALSLIRSLADREPGTLQASVNMAAAAREIFTTGSFQRPLAEAIHQAVNDSRSDISGRSHTI